MDWMNFDPLGALIGGGLIGAASVLLMLGLGRIAGISGILGNLVDAVLPGVAPKQAELLWRAAFVIGLILGGIGAAAILGGFSPEISAPWPILLAGGLLVGFGTRLGGGCTSGHGICGLARFSSRSLMATLVFMATAMIAVFVLRHLVGG
jgi:uncharacterized protein